MMDRQAPHPAVLWGLAVVGVAAAVGTVVLARASDDLARPIPLALVLDWIALPFVVAGVIAWSRRPDSRLGPLMVAAGFTVWLSALQWANNPVVYTVGALTDSLVVALFLHVYLAYPTGQLARQPERRLVQTGYVVAIVPQVLRLLLGGEPGNAIDAFDLPGLAGAVQGVQIAVLILLCIAAAALLVIRGRQGPPVRRRPTALLIDVFRIGLVMMAVMFATALTEAAVYPWVQLTTFGVLGLVPIVFLLGLLDARLARSGVGDLLVQLRAQPAGDLREPLARALRDPSLTVVYWLPDFGAWADHDGRPVSPPEETPGRGSAFIRRHGDPVAALLFDPGLQDERELLEAVTAAAGIALENDRLQVDLRARVKELQESRMRMLQAGQEERQRLERNLHDGAQQRLVALSLELGMIEASLHGDTAVVQRVRRAREEVGVSLEELRDIARGIYPAVLSSHGLAVALESLLSRSPVPVQLHVDTDGRLPAPVEAAVYYLACETLTNIGKHARASAASISVTRQEGRVVVEVIDDGVGGADTERGTGLRGLADRVEALGGQLRIWTPSGGGTRVRAEMLC